MQAKKSRNRYLVKAALLAFLTVSSGALNGCQLLTGLIGPLLSGMGPGGGCGGFAGGGGG